MILASIDIGTNTILMTIAKGENSKNFEVIDDVHSIARLGEGVGKTGIISLDAINRAELILTDYRTLLDMHRVDRVVAVCTSAMRDARNGLEIIKKFSNIIGGPVLIIEGEEEANLSYFGTIENPNESALIDIGGGSTEIILGNNFEVNYRVSTQLGAVRLSEKYFSKMPPIQYEVDAFVSFVQSNLAKIPYGDFAGEVYGVAGTATTLAAMDLRLLNYDKSLIHNHSLFFHKITALTDELLLTSTDDIVLKYNIPQKRADILPAGAIILREIMRSMSANNIIVSTYGLRYGLLKKLFDSQK